MIATLSPIWINERDDVAPETRCVAGIVALASAEETLERHRFEKARNVIDTKVIKLRGDEISVSAKQAARLIGLPLRTLQAETKAGKIPAARRIGRRYVYLIEELRRMVETSIRPGTS